MLKFLFWFLLLANSVLFAYHQGYLTPLFPDGREPERAARQFNVDKIKLIPANSEGNTSTAPSTAASPSLPPATTIADSKQMVIACTEIGNFDAEEAKQFEARMASLALGKRLSRRTVPDSIRHIVFIPPQGSKERADKKAEELRQLGIQDFYVIQEGKDYRWGVSLGIFKTEASARNYLALLNQKGVHSARLGPYGAESSKIAFQLHSIDAGVKTALDAIRVNFPQQQLRDCEPE
ncbi:MAG TPA: SPOR domain-containing protein [Paucimonas sp.]|nr:SPOR domain-containing protein [Paucimonas sp.]